MPELVEVEPDVSLDAAYKPEWHECTVVFRLLAGNVLALDGWRYGTLAVHATWHDPQLKPFTVCHLPSLLAACRFAEVEQALAAAERLWCECPRIWAARDVNVRVVPLNVVQYCEENL